MMQEFSYWLARHGLVEVFTTSDGDSMYVNREKMFGVIRKRGEYAAHSFYLDDIIEFKTYDDENLIVEWSTTSPWNLRERSTRFTTNEVYMKIRFRNGQCIKLQIFRAYDGNIKRNTNEHIDLLNYACRISHIVFQCATGQ